MDRDLDGKVAVITGAARGIGLAIARRFSALGARIVAWELDAGPLAGDASVALAHAARVGVADWASVQAGLAETLAACGQVDILVNNAGISGPTVAMPDYPLDAWDRVIAIDLMGVFYCCRAVVPHMTARGSGRIVNIASMAGKDAIPNISAYSAAKAGVIGFTKSIARELVTSGVLVNAIAPAMAETDLLKEMTPDYIAAIKARMPMGRLAGVDEIAEVAAFAASPRCSFTTGFVYEVSGGRAIY